MGDKLKITGMEIKTSEGEVHNLTMKEAKELYTQLHKLFGEKDPQTIIIEKSSPIIIERDRWPWGWPYGTPMWTYTTAVEGTVGGAISENVSINYQFEEYQEK